MVESLLDVIGTLAEKAKAIGVPRGLVLNPLVATKVALASCQERKTKIQKRGKKERTKLIQKEVDILTLVLSLQKSALDAKENNAKRWVTGSNLFLRGKFFFSLLLSLLVPTIFITVFFSHLRAKVFLPRFATSSWNRMATDYWSATPFGATPAPRVAQSSRLFFKISSPLACQTFLLLPLFDLREKIFHSFFLQRGPPLKIFENPVFGPKPDQGVSESRGRFFMKVGSPPTASFAFLQL